MERINMNVMGWTTNPRIIHHRRDYVRGKRYRLPVEVGYFYPFQLVRDRSPFGITRFEIVREEDGQVFNVLADMVATGLSIIPGDTSDTIRYLGTVALPGFWEQGLYHAKMSDGSQTWETDTFCMVADVSEMVKVEWWHNEPIRYRDGVIDYAYPYRNYIWLATDIGKPTYPVDQEVKVKNGVEIPLRVTTWKQYNFEHLIPEYLADVLRTVHQHHNKRVYHLGEVYDCQRFSLDNLTWEEYGRLAVAEFVFRTDTVVTTLSNPGSSAAPPSPSQCLPVRYTVNRILGISELINNLDNLGSFGIVGDHIAINSIIDLGAGPTGAFNVNQITHLSTNPDQTRVRDAVAGDLFFDITTEKYFVHTGTALGFSAPKILTITETTLTGLALTGSTVEVFFMREGEMFTRLASFTAAQINAGIPVDPSDWFAAKLVFLTPTCGVLQESQTFVLNLPEPEVLRGWNYGTWDGTLIWDEPTN